MRLNKLILATVLTVSAVLLPSCLKNQEDLFGKSATERVQETLDLAKTTLMSSEYGWAFDYYPDRYIRYGGWVYTLQFDASKVTVMTELAPGMSETSLYKLTNDNGPVLSFDTYNDLMHFFATPSSSKYEAYDGDFEFIIMDVKPDVIKVRGNRTGNVMYMHRLTQPADTYVDQAASMGEDMFFTELEGTQGDAPISAQVYLGERYFEFIWGETEDDVDGNYYVPTPTGLRFVEPVNVNGAIVSTIDFNGSTLHYTTTDSKGNVIDLTGDIPEDYAFYDDYLGSYTLTYNGTRTMDITIENAGNGMYKLNGMSSKFDVFASFNKSKGCLEINSQQVAMDGNTVYWVCGLSDDGYLSWSTDCGLYAIKDVNNPGTFLFETNDYTDTPAVSLLVWKFNGSASSANSIGQGVSPWVFANGISTIDNLVSLVKK